jgi:hypothetical protein
MSGDHSSTAPRVISTHMLLRPDPVSRGVYREHGVAEGAAHVAQVLGRRNQIHAFLLWVGGWPGMCARVCVSRRQPERASPRWRGAELRRRGIEEKGEIERGRREREEELAGFQEKMGYGFYYCNKCQGPAHMSPYAREQPQRSIGRRASCLLRPVPHN